MTHETAPARPIQSDSLDKLLPALLDARKAMTNPTKEKANTHFKSKYADLAACKEAGDEALAAHGLFVNDIRTNNGLGYEELVTTLWHAASGQFLRAHARLAPLKDDPQGYGSAMTYARRYNYLALTGLAPEDDDGNDAGEPGAGGPPPPPPHPVPAPPKPLFATEAALIGFQESVRQRFRAAGTVAELEQAQKDLAAQLAPLKASTLPAEVAAAAALRADYRDRKAALAATPATPTQQTVVDVLNDDQIPY